MGVKDSFLGRLLKNADKYTDDQVTQTITLLVENGVKHGATDIHIEPHDTFAAVRYRINGQLHSRHKLPIAALPAVLTEIKTLADLHSRDDLPQSGQYATLVGEEQMEVQVHTLPVVGGEKVTMHLMRRLAKPPTLEALGYWGQALLSIQTALSRTHGLIVVGMPRRAGQTTTLHSMLQLVSTPTLSVATVENRLEYRLQGVNQTIAKPHRGITFHEGLQAVINQDPNVVMITTVPDKATAEIAVQAAVGGHLLIAGIHANNAATALTHLRSLANEPFLMTTAVKVAISQRLVRALCVHCRERYIPSNEQVAELEKVFGITAVAARKTIHELESKAAAAGIDHNKHVNTSPSHITGLWRASEEGCEACNHSGYQGAIAIVEALSSSEGIQKAILNHEPAGTIRSIALKEGFVPMELDGLVKALRGRTTVQEIMRTFAD
jgi:type II secretory ATPase GspE/PulE/Tfp pilus assembly ATPase PilB-like protein